MQLNPTFHPSICAIAMGHPLQALWKESGFAIIPDMLELTV